MQVDHVADVDHPEPQIGSPRHAAQLVIAASRALFAEQGFDATSLQQIADRMGVTKANVYYYFRTKDALLEALLTPLVGGLEVLLDEAEQVTDRDERVQFMVTGFVEQVVTAYRTVGSLNLGDPGLRRHVAATRTLDDLSERGLHLVFGPSPTPDQQAGWWQTRDLAPVLRRLDQLPDEELKRTLERLCLRAIQV